MTSRRRPPISTEYRLSGFPGISRGFPTGSSSTVSAALRSASRARSFFAIAMPKTRSAFAWHSQRERILSVANARFTRSGLVRLRVQGQPPRRLGSHFDRRAWAPKRNDGASAPQTNSRFRLAVHMFGHPERMSGFSSAREASTMLVGSHAAAVYTFDHLTGPQSRARHS